MQKQFSGHVALVTGAGNGIGRATALAFAAHGLKVVVSDIDTPGGEETVAQIKAAGGEASFVQCNVAREEEVKALIARTVATYGRLDYAFNNAGIDIEKGRLADSSEAEFDANPQYTGVNPREGRNLLDTFGDYLGFVENDPAIVAASASLSLVAADGDFHFPPCHRLRTCNGGYADSAVVAVGDWRRRGKLCSLPEICCWRWRQRTKR